MPTEINPVPRLSGTSIDLRALQVLTSLNGLTVWEVNCILTTAMQLMHQHTRTDCTTDLFGEAVTQAEAHAVHPDYWSANRKKTKPKH